MGGTDVTLTIERLLVDDLRFPTSRERHGSDAMNRDPDYSAAYVTLATNTPLQGHGLVFTLGRGNEICAAAVAALRPLVEGRTLDEIVSQFAMFWRELTQETQLRWLGPEKGVVHMATAAIVNAVWDLWAKQQGKPLWQLVCDLSPEQLVSCIDFRYLTDELTPDDATDILSSRLSTRQQRIEILRQQGYPAYTTSAGWLGYDDEYLRQRCRAAIADGWQSFKVKVGANLDQDRHRLRIVRSEIGPDRILMLDANQIWDVDQAIAWTRELSEFQPLWIEEPTCPDDILGHAKIARAVHPIGVATGEAAQNRVLFKQLLQAQAIRYCQLDSCRLAGVNEVLAVMLLAAKFGVPVCPHGGGVGLCEHTQHLSIIDFVCISGSLEDRYLEYVDHLHEHFTSPVQVRNGRYIVPTSPGYSLDLKAATLVEYRFPDGPVWQRQRP